MQIINIRSRDNYINPSYKDQFNKRTDSEDEISPKYQI